MRAGSILGSLAMAMLLQNGAAVAEDCGPLKQINALDLVAGPNRALVPVSINGVPKLFLLDTGGDISQINGAAAEELGLPQSDSGRTMLDMYGHASTKKVRIEKFAIGRQIGENLYMAIQPNPDFGKGTRYVGLFAPDLMGRYDVEIDFGTYKMKYFSPDHCDGHVVYWPHAALAVTPMTFRRRHIRLLVRVDGKELKAEIDTGATNTSMMAEAAQRLFGIVPQTPSNVPLDNHGMTGAFGHIFSTLDFEGVAVKNPHVAILPDLIGSMDPNNAPQTGTRTKMFDDVEDRPDMLIGMDILKKLHFYIAFGENRLYISEASTPPNAATSTASAASGAQ